MNPNPITVPPSLSIEDLVEHYIYAYHYKMFPVARDGDLLGCVTIQQVKGVPRGEWPRHTVGELVRPCSDENTLPANADALAALATMHRAGVSRLMVVDGPRLVGIVTLKDMLKFLGLKVELESGA
jgi:predicted transcriptional regulator